MSTTLAPFTTSPGPTIRPLTIANLRPGEYKIVPSTASNGTGGGSAGRRMTGGTVTAGGAGAGSSRGTGGRTTGAATGGGAAGGGCRAGVTGVAPLAGASGVGPAGATGVGLAGATGVGLAGAVATGDVTRATGGVTGDGPGTAGVGCRVVATEGVARATGAAGAGVLATDGGNATAGNVTAGFGAAVAVLAVLLLLPVLGGATATVDGADGGFDTATAGVSCRDAVFARAGAGGVDGTIGGGGLRAIGSGVADCHHWLCCIAQPAPNPAATPATTAARANASRRFRRR